MGFFVTKKKQLATTIAKKKRINILGSRVYNINFFLEIYIGGLIIVNVLSQRGSICLCYIIFIANPII